MHRRVIPTGLAHTALALALCTRGSAWAQSNPVRGTSVQYDDGSAGRDRAYDVAKWTLALSAIMPLGTGVLFQVLAANDAARITEASMQQDPQTGLPVYSYSELRAAEISRQTNQSLAIGFFVGAGVLAGASAVFWLLPRTPSGRGRTATLDLSPAGLALRGTF